MVRDFHDRQTGMLLMRWTQPAIGGTSFLDGCGEMARDTPGPDKRERTLIIFGVLTHQRLAVAMFGTKFQEKNLLILNHHLCLNDLQTLRTGAHGHFEKGVRTILAFDIRLHSASRSSALSITCMLSYLTAASAAHADNTFDACLADTRRFLI
jgi:hypothetical protein